MIDGNDGVPDMMWLWRRRVEHDMRDTPTTAGDVPTSEAKVLGGHRGRARLPRLSCECCPLLRMTGRSWSHTF